MNVNTGQLYASYDEAVLDAKPGERVVELLGDEAAVLAVATDIRKQRETERRRAKNRAGRKTRAKNRLHS